uniref:Uncharacterized protein n=1 Tax=Opuntia streptacantha TaxID=393608 RepID=A0A7C9DG60_OPUST
MNSSMPCPDALESLFTAIACPSSSFPLYTGPNPPVPSMLLSWKLSVALASFSNVSSCKSSGMTFVFCSDRCWFRIASFVLISFPDGNWDLVCLFGGNLRFGRALHFHRDNMMAATAAEPKMTATAIIAFSLVFLLPSSDCASLR